MQELSLRELQLAELDILIEFDRVCRENGLRYSLGGGTLLGAIRHKGFIPWDDDIDVLMPRPDYEKMIAVFSQRENSDFVLSASGDHGSVYPFSKLLNRKIAVVREGMHDSPYLWMDIFPVDGLPADENELRKIYKKNKFYIRIIHFSLWNNLKEYHGRHSKAKAFLIGLFVKLYGAKRALKKLERLSRRYPYGSTEHVGCIAWGLYGPGERMPVSAFDPLTEVEFEGKHYSAVSCWDEYLSGIYGDYMQLPPEDKRKTHTMKAYRVPEQ